MSDRIMKKISLNVLLRFLSKYSHWNLVRKSDGYHLFFLARDGDSERRSHNGKQKTRKLASVTCNKIRRNKIRGKSQSKKDVFVFNPIFNNVEEGVSVGLDSAVGISRRSSLNSFIWDDFLPTYNKESDEEAFRKTLSGSESSGRSTPVQVPRVVEATGSEVTERLCEASMLRQGDRLLREMLQLRKDLEKEKLDSDFALEDTEKKCNLLPSYGPLDHGEEKVLREKLEIMTQQIKKEMEEQFNRNPSGFDSSLEENSKIRNIFKSLFQDQNTDGEGDRVSNKVSLKSAMNNLLQMNDEVPETFEEAQKHFSNTSVDAEKKVKTKAKSKSKTKQPKEELHQTVEVPFCSHSNVPNVQTEALSPVKEETSQQSRQERRQVLLTPDEQIAAEEILKELVEIKNSGERGTDPVLDTMIR